MTNGGKIKTLVANLKDRFTAYIEKAYGSVDLGEEFASAMRIIGRVVYSALAIVLDIVITLLLVCAITGIIVVAAFAVYVNNYIDPTFDTDLIITDSEQTSQLWYMDYSDREHRIGEPVEVDDQVLVGSEYSLWARYDELPEDLIDAVIAIEDQRFRSHHGVDWFRTIAAAANQVLHLKSTFGGSTITQQVVKNTTHDDDFTIQRKVQEILRALNLESKYSKEQIITMYLNIISLSQNCTGVQSAAHTYFSKDVKDLTLIECAALAAIPKSPYKYDPLRHPDNNTDRRRDVLDKMLELGFITREEYDEAYYADLELNISRSSGMQGVTSWYTDAVIEDVINDYVEKYGVSRELASLKIYTGGWNIYSVMDPDMQETIERIYLDDQYFPASDTGIKPQSAAVIIDPTTGDLLAIAGGRGEKTESRGLNRATQAKRPCGSVIKPLSVYGPLIDSGQLTWGSVFDDVPVNFGNYDDPKDARPYPMNAPNVYDGLTTVYDALRVSKNTCAVRGLQMLGLENSYAFLHDRCHMESVIDKYETESGEVKTDILIAPLALGQFTYGITVREITAAYQIFANKGLYNYTRTYIKVTDQDGNVILSTEDKPSEVVISEQTATIMTKLLEGVVDGGTAAGLPLSYTMDVAAKTGTTSADYDRYFIGYTPYYLCGVWFGYDLNQTLSGYWTNPAMTIWNSIMTEVHSDIIADVNSGKTTMRRFEDASGVVQATFCRDSGKLMTEACKKDPRGSRAMTGYFTVDTVPTETCDVHVLVNYDKTTGGVASQYCSEDDITQYGLIKVENRSFPIEVYVTDAQYVYRELPKNIKPAGWSGDPFFVNMLRKDEFCGRSWVTTPFNHFCYQHYNYDKSTGIDTSHFDEGKEPEPPVTEPPDTEPPDTEPPDTEPPETEQGDEPQGNRNGMTPPRREEVSEAANARTSESMRM